MNRPRLIVTEEHLIGLDRTTQESRKRMTVPELIAAMGSSHVNHPQFKPRPRSLLPLPNITNVNGRVIECYDARLMAQIRKLISWGMQ